MTSIEHISEAEHDQWHRFIDGVNALVAEVFGEEGATIVLGAQWGEMGQPGNEAVCLVTSNIPVCAVGEALADMRDEAEAEHRRYHGQPEPVAETVALADAPEEVQQIVRSLMEEYGVTEDQVVISHTVDTTDLADPLAALNVPLPGDPETVEGTD